ncbi:MAG: hypothetical protein ABIB71_00640 [Candidatus Woesearchaeota archaeon]
MKPSLTDLEIMASMASGKALIKEIAAALKKSEKQIYRASKKLSEIGLIERSRGKVSPSRTVFTNLLLQLLSESPQLKTALSGSGITILTILLSPRTPDSIIEETGLQKSIIYKKLKQAIAINAVRRENGNYTLNKDIWPLLVEFLAEFQKYQETIDPRVPTNSVIYKKDNKYIIFSNGEEQDAALTAFSVYKDFGIKLLLTTNYYCLPKKKLSRQEIFLHSLYIAEKEKSVRLILYTSLFYLKFRKNISRIKHPLLGSIKQVLDGERIEGLPKLNEIREKAEIYDIGL